MVKLSHNKFGRIDILVNNAGIHVKSAPVEDVDESVWDRAYAVNVKGAFLTTKYVVPEMKKARGGVIINIASVAGLRPGMRASAYSSSKGAVIALTRALALELAPFNIRVNCINPAITDTRMAKQLSEESKKALTSAIPLGRIAKPEDIAYAALYLASDESAMLTGSGINVDGGAGI